MSRSAVVVKLSLSALVMLSLGAATWWGAEALVISRMVSEGRTVADMAENVGKWASQYGGVHVRTQGAGAGLPGTFLTRSVYAVSEDDAQFLQGSRASGGATEREAMQRIEAYHWKNPALIQRELADVLQSAGSRAQYRLTARTVLNQNNAPNAFELEALTALQNNSAQTGSTASNAAQEYWRVQNGQLKYARAVVAQKSCLKCHDTAERAPDFLRTNQQFNGGGGFGYVPGKPAGVISVTMPMPSTEQLLRSSLPDKAWLALAAGALSGLALLVLSLRKRPRA